MLTLLWGLAVAGSRILYFFLRKQEAVDTYEYFVNAMIRMEESDITLNSGLAYAYTGNLSGLLRFTGNRIEAVCVYQMVLQILWIILLFVGISLVFGKLAGIVSASILAVLPMVLKSILIVSPENFYMLNFSFILIILGIFLNRTGNEGWYRSNFCELYLMISGFYVGVISTWNYVGWCLAAVIVYILIQNYFALRVGIWEQKHSEEREVREQLMGAGSQAFILIAGIAVGMYATLMKYTGLTGQTIVEQFKWWTHQFSSFPGRCQDVSMWLLPALVGAGLMGIFCRMLLVVFQRKEQMKEMQVKENQMEAIRAAGEEKQDDYVITEDGRRIKLLDNPLPLPKKHIRKEIDFDLDEIEMNHDEKDFDFQVSDSDDFDF